MECRCCGRTFKPNFPGSMPQADARVSAQTSLTASARPPRVPQTAVAAGSLPSRWAVVCVGLLTPFLASVVLALIFPVLTLFPILGLAAGPAAGHLSAALMCRIVYRRAGRLGLLSYIRTSIASFVLWGAAGVIGMFIMMNNLDEGAGLVMPMMVLAVGGGYLFLVVFWIRAARSVASSAT